MNIGRGLRKTICHPDNFMQPISLKDLLEAGCHFGHQVSRWNPRAKDFIYTERDGVHIIDLAKTKEGLEAAAAFVKTTASQGGTVIFVGTKRQARAIIQEEAKACGALYLIERFPGGLLTNWSEIKKNLDKLNRMREEKTNDSWAKFTKKEQLMLSRELLKLEVLYGGVAGLKGLPQAIFLVDIKKEEGAVREAARMEVLTIAICDTNTNPDTIDYPIPANDDALGSIKFITHSLAEAFKEGKEIFEKTKAAESEKPLTIKKIKKSERPAKRQPASAKVRKQKNSDKSEK